MTHIRPNSNLCLNTCCNLVENNIPLGSSSVWAHYDSSQYTTILDANGVDPFDPFYLGYVEQWLDISGNNFHLVRAGTVNQIFDNTPSGPVGDCAYTVGGGVTAIGNGNRQLRYTFPAQQDGFDYEFYFVGDLLSTPPTNGSIFNTGQFNQPGNWQIGRSGGSEPANTLVFRSNNAGNAGAGNSMVYDTIANLVGSGTRIFRAQYTHNSGIEGAMKLFLDGVLVDQRPTFNSAFDRLGVFVNRAQGTGANSTAKEIIILNQNLSDAQAQKLDLYLKCKWELN